jgi:C4-dicarboxylate-specific signal transduction histidine kinase
MMRVLFLMVALTGLIQLAAANDTDSLVVEDLQYLKKRINLLIYRLNQMDNTTAANLDSLKTLSLSSLDEMKQMEKQAASRHHSLNDSISKHSGRLQLMLTHARNKLKQQFTTRLILHSLAILLVTGLIVLLWRQRRQSLDYLIKKTERTARQNDEILEKTSEIKEIRSVLEKNLKQQKKIKKRLKKKK